MARIFCALFAFIGILPVILWGLARTDRVKSWAERETAALIQKELGVTASYTVEVTLWPLGLELNDLEVPDTRGGEPAFAADRISVQPRVFALLGGRVQVGDIEVDRPRIRVRIKDGELTNVAYRLPEASGGSTSASPFTSLSISDAVIDADIEGNLISTTAMDVDVYAEPGPSFEVAVRAAESHIERTRKTFDTPSVVAVDEDVVCQLDLRARYSGTTLLVRRLSLLGAADLDIERGTRPKCSIDQVRDTKRQVALRASQFRVDFDNGDSLIPKLQGNVVMRAPVVLTNRFVKAPPLKGWIGASVDVSFDGRNKLPDVRGKLRGGKLKLEGYRIAKYLDASLTIDRDVINVPTFKAGWADADVTFKDIVVKPFADKPSIAAREAVVERMTFPGLMRDLDVTRKTVVRWDINKATITNVRGTLDPVHIDAEIIANTDDFEIYDKAYNHPARKHMIGVRAATVRAKIGVRPNAFEFYDIRNTFGKSQLTGKLVSIGFKNDLTLVVGGPGTRVAFEDISPLVDIPIAGMSQFSATMTGKASNPTLKGKMRIANLVFGGFPIGDITHTDVFFRPLKVDIRNAKGKKGSSHFKVPHARLDFDADAAVLVTADVKSDDLKVRDFLSMWHFEKDPRFDGLFGVGKVNARVEFDYGGRRDRCGGGYLAVNGDAGFKKLEIFEERYDTGSAAFDFRWMDRDASHLGMAVDIPSMTLTKGSGAVLGSLRVSDGGRITGNVVGTGIPLNTLQALGELGPIVDGYASGLAQVSGTIDDLSLDANVGVSPVGIGLGTLPSSRVALRLRPTKREQKTIGTTKCGRPMPSEFSRRQYDRDEVQGVFTASGSLFGGQVKLSELTVTRQRAKIVAGSAELSKLDLGVFTQLSPALALDKQRPDGELSGLVTIEHLPLEKYEDAKVSFDIADAALRRGGLTARIAQSGKSIRYDRGDVFVPALGVNVETQGGFRARFDVAGQVTDVLTKREVDMSLKLRPIDLSKLVRRVPRVERADGRVTGGIRVRGPPSALRYSGGFKVEGGELAVAGLPSALSKVNIAVVVDGDELRITKGNAKLGGGAVNLSGNAKLGSSGVANARAVVSAKNVSLPIMSGVEAAADAKLIATWESAGPGASDGEALPRITGNINIRNFAYNRPVRMTADLASLAQRGKRTEFEAYDPADDSVKFDIIIRSNRPLKISNNLVEAELEIGKQGLLLAGTNQRYGMRGLLSVKSGGRIRLRRNEFEVRQGRVRFSDLTRIDPEVDVTAVTEYRRYRTSVSATSTSAPSGGGGGSRASGAAGGRWFITMRAHGDAENLKVDLSSDPGLAQDDIFLLLTVGLTRAELDQAQSASVGGSVALEALGTLSGADRAVTQAIPVIDDFGFGSAYSSRTGRTQPTVTVGKRLAERIRASVTSGIGAESREVRSNLEWRVGRRLSVEASYDNVNDISSTTGNVGMDVRWRLEFE